MNLLKKFKNRKFQARYNKDIEKIGGVFLLELDEKAYKCYIEHTNGRENTGFDLARKLLTRNILLAEPDETYRKTFNYGNLKIILNHNNKITYVRNSYEKSTMEIDTEYRNWLNEKLGIVDNKVRRKVS